MTWARRSIAAFLVAGVAILAAVGWLGSPALPERFDAKTIVVRPEGADGLRVTEIVDLDTGTARRHGYLRELPHTFGIPADIVATSPNASADVNIEMLDDATVIRVGDPDVTVRGRHRYVLEYTLPEAGWSDGTFALDVVGTVETLSTTSLAVYVSGLDLDQPFCATGPVGATGGCDLIPTDIGFVAGGSLAPAEGFTVGGLVRNVTAPIAVPEPVLPPSRQYPPTWPRVLLLVTLAAGALGWARRWSQQRGRNEIAGDSAADAAYATTEAPVRLVTDAELQSLATVEFAPPEGLTPWEGAVLLSERLDDAATEAWWAHASATGRVRLEEHDGALTIVDVPEGPRLSPAEEAALDSLFAGGRQRFEVGGYDVDFASAWSRLAAFQRQRIESAAWWRKRIGANRMGAAVAGAAMLTLFALGLLAAMGAGIADDPSLDSVVITSLWGAGCVVVVLGLAVGALLWSHLRASRTAVGSALALRTLSFQRFLAASEARHVEEAWKRGVIREYTAWAVALGEADTWKRAAGAASVPMEATSAVAGTALLAQHRGDLGRAHTKPSQGTSSGGSGFGSVGSGGGGGRSGSW